MLGLSLSCWFPATVGRNGTPTAPIITATSAPTLGALTDAQTPADGYTAGSYESTAGTIASAVATYLVNGVSVASDTNLAASDTVQVSVLVTDSVGNTRTFTTGTVTVSIATSAPGVTASDALSGRTLTITVDSLTGYPEPDVALTVLTLDGDDVLADAAGTGPWTYAVPSSASDQDVAWTVTASNGVSPDATASGGETVAADLAAPAFTTQPSISPSSGEPGDTFSISEGVATGSPSPTLEITAFTLDGVDKLGELSGLTWDSTGEADGTISVTVTADNGVGGPATATATAEVADAAAANFQSINTDGWSVTYASPPTFDPGASPETFTVAREGFDATGAAVTVHDTLLCTTRVREPYPDQAALSADRVAVSDYIYTGDVVTGAANNSTRAAPRPICSWLHHDNQRAIGGQFTARLAVAHMHARHGKPIAAVRFIASDGTDTVEQLVSALTPISYAASGLTVPHFSADLDLTSLTPNALLTLDVIVYPWIGAAYQASVHGGTYPTINFSTLRVLNDISFGNAYAYVDAVAGNNTSGAVSATPATAAAAPFLTVAAAAAAIKTFNNTTYGRNFASGGTVRLVEGTHTHGSFSAATTDKLPLVIEAADPAKKATTVYQDAGTSSTGGAPGKVKFRNLTLQRNGTGNVIFLDNGAGTLSENMLAFENVTFDSNGLGTYYAAWLYRVGRVWATDCTSDRGNVFGAFGTVNKMPVAFGCRNLVGLYNTLGCYGLQLAWSDGSQNSGSREAGVGLFIGFSHLALNNTAGRVVDKSQVIGVEGFAVVGNVIEDIDGSTSPTLWIGADGNTSAMDNVIVQQNTVVGERTNFLYQDTGTVTIAKVGAVRNSVFYRFNTKSDVFGANANLVGNWGPRFHVGYSANCFLNGSDNGDDPSNVCWIGEVLHPTEATAGASQVDPDWLDDASGKGTGLGGGDYTPGPSTALAFVPAGRTAYPVDQKGRAIPNDGTAYAGALQAAV